MRTTFLQALLLLFTVVGFSGVGYAANDTTQINCTGIDSANTIDCGTFTTEDLRGLAGDLQGIDQCATDFQNDQNLNSCSFGRLTCSRVGANGAACGITGVLDTTFSISCPTINNTDASCTITNNIAALTNTLTLGGGNISALLTPAQLALGNTLLAACANNFGISTTLQNDCNTFIALVDADNTDAADLLDAITPSAASAAIDSSQTSLRAQNRNVAQRMNSLRRSGLGQKEELSFNGLQIRSNGRLVNLGQEYPELKQALRQATGGSAGASSPGRLGVFLNGTADWGDKDNTANERGFSFSGSDLTLGVDYILSDASFMGMAFGMSSSSVSLNDNRGSLDNNGYNFIIYASILPIKNMYLDANIIIGGNTFEQDRNIMFTSTGLTPTVSINQVASASYFGDQFAASLTAGRDFVQGSLTMSPYAVLQVANSTTKSYSESISDITAPGAGYALQIDEQEYKSTTLTIGGQFTYVVSLGRGVLIPQIKLDWIKEFQDGVNVVSGNFIGDPNKTKFRLPTDKPDDTYFQLGLGTTGIIPGGTTYYIFYQTYLAYENLSSSSVNLGVRWEL